MTSILSAFPFIGEQSFATPGAFNSPLSILSANIAAVNAAVGGFSGVTISPPSGNTITITSALSITGQVQSGPLHTDGPVRIDANSNLTNYLYLSDVSNLRSNYIIGSQVGGTADGLNIWDDSGQTMIASFSKQSVRFFQQVVGPVFDVGGALSDTLNAATFGTGSDSTESRIQAAVNAASLAAISRVYVPASMYPYSASSISFIHTVQMVREGGDWSTYDVRAYGASGTTTPNDWFAVQSAISGAQQVSGGLVYMPPGTYSVSSTVLIPQNVRVTGVSRGETAIRATAGFSTSTAVVRLGDGLGLNFGCRIENLAIDCAGVAGSIGLYSSDMQEQSGANHILIHNEMAYGILISSTSSSGANALEPDHFLLDDVEIAANSTATNAVGLYYTGNRRGGQVRRLTITNNNASVNQPTGVLIASPPGFTSALKIDGLNVERHVDGVSFSTGGGGVVIGASSLVSFTNLIKIGSNSTQPVLCCQLFADMGHSAAGGSLVSNLLTGTALTDGRVELYSMSSTGQEFYLPTTTPFISSLSVGSGSSGTLAVTGPLFARGQILGMPGNAGSPSYSFASSTTIGMFEAGGNSLRWTTDGSNTAMILSGPALTVGYTGASIIPILVMNGTSVRDIRSQQSGTDRWYIRVENTAETGSDVGSNWELIAFTDAGGVVDRPMKIIRKSGGQIQFNRPSIWNDGTALQPPWGFSSESSLGYYRSGASTMALSYGTLNLASQGVRLSMRTIAASALTASAANTNVAVNECVFTVSASGASFAINSGGTTWVFNSDASAKNI